MADIYESYTCKHTCLTAKKITCSGNYPRRAEAYVAAKTLSSQTHTATTTTKTLTRPTRRDCKTGFTFKRELPFKLCSVLN